jgi:hypothetical protein
MYHSFSRLDGDSLSLPQANSFDTLDKLYHVKVQRERQSFTTYEQLPSDVGAWLINVYACLESQVAQLAL